MSGTVRWALHLLRVDLMVGPRLGLMVHGGVLLLIEMALCMSRMLITAMILFMLSYRVLKRRFLLLSGIVRWTMHLLRM